MHLAFWARPVLLLLAGLVSGCAAISTGTNQSISIQTSPQAGATCQASNSSGTWHVPTTPGSVTVAKSYSDLQVFCRHKDGMEGQEQVKSTTGVATFGNALIGGGVGIVIDVASGAAYNYPQTITVFLNAPGMQDLIAESWKAPAAGTRIAMNNGAVSVNAIEGDTLFLSDGNGSMQRSLYGIIAMLPNAKQISLVSGSLFPMKVGAEAVLSETPNAGGAVLEHRIAVKGVEDVTIGQAKHRAFRLVDNVSVVGTSNLLQDERRDLWYVPDLGMVVRSRTETLNGAPVAARSFEVTKIGG